MDEILNQFATPPTPLMEEEDEHCPIPKLSKYSTREEFENWKETLLNYLNLNDDNKKFLQEGVYSEWSITRGDKRIRKLNYKFELGSKSITELSNINCNELLEKRNSQLNDLIALILELSNNIGRDDVLYQSESFNMIFEIISENIDFDSNNSSILEIGKMNFDVKISSQGFYDKFRTCIVKHAEKYKEKIDSYSDETISPFLEDLMIIWCLEKINPKLPTQVEDKFSKLLSNSYLFDMTSQIFESIPDLLTNGPIERDNNKTVSNTVKEYLIGEIENEHRPSESYISVKNSVHLVNDCRLCKRSFETKDEKDKHMDLAHKKTNISTISEDKIQLSEFAYKDFNCDKCKRNFKSQKFLDRHTNWYCNVSKKYCEVCKASFVKKETLLLHKKQKHSDLLCCGKYFTSKYLLEIHTRLYCIAEKNLDINPSSNVVLGKIPTSDINETDFISDVCKIETIEGKEINETEISLKINKINNKGINSLKNAEDRKYPHKATQINKVAEIEKEPSEFDKIQSTYFNEQDTVQKSSNRDDFYTNQMKVSNYPKEQVFLQIEEEQHKPEHGTTPINLKDIVVKNGVKYLKIVKLDREVYNCIVCKKTLSSKENMYLHMKSHFPGTEQSSLFAQLLESMKPIQVRVYLHRQVF